MQDQERNRDELLKELAALRQELATAKGATPAKKLGAQGMPNPTRQQRVTAESIAGQIAHDFNNMLTPLVAYPALIRNDLPEGSMGRESLDLLEKSARNMARITQRLLALSNRRSQEKQLTDINALLNGIVPTLQPPEGVSINMALAKGTQSVLGVDERLGEALRNMCVNAVEAMTDAGGGTLTVKTERVMLSSPVGRSSQIVAGTYVKTTISDTGPGIDPKIRATLFEPFVTTRKQTKGRGAGLGLAIVHTVIKEHNGYLDVSTSEKGSTFSIYLPAYDEDVAIQTLEDIKGGTESILIIDDDQTQIQIMSKILSKLGYQVAGAQTGEQAVEYVKQNKPDLLLLDLMLDPGIDGAETYRRIKEINPDQRAIIVSAYEDSEKIDFAQSLGAARFVKKISTVESLGKAVRSELDDALAGAEGGKEAEGPFKILLVDDEEMIRTLFEMILSSAIPDAEIDQATNGDEAVKLFSEKRHSLLVMDLNMPIMDGREAFGEIERICKEQGREMPPVIFCSGFAPPDSIKKIVGTGGVHCLLPKPVTEDDLLAEIKKRVDV